MYLFQDAVHAATYLALQSCNWPLSSYLGLFCSLGTMGLVLALAREVVLVIIVAQYNFPSYLVLFPTVLLYSKWKWCGALMCYLFPVSIAVHNH
jgi:hypothetical protein